MNYKNRILILFAHPALHKSRVNRRLIDEIKKIDGITFHNIYEEYPDFHIDIKREQELLLKHDIIIWHHPLYWYSSPAIIKEWIDLVLEHGFAFGRTGTALQGKKTFNIISTGGSSETYKDGGFNNFTIRQFMAPFFQTTRLCKMEYLAPYVVYGTHLMSEEEIAVQAEKLAGVLEGIRDGIYSPEELSSIEYLHELKVLSKNI